MIDAPMSPEERAECYARLRAAILRIEVVFDDETGMAYFDDLLVEDEQTSDLREVVPDDVTKRQYQRALAHQFETFLTEACPHATVRVSHGDKYSVAFTLVESSVFFSNEEVWDAINAYDEERATELCSNAYDSLTAEQHIARRRAHHPRAKRQLSRRRGN